MERTKNHVDASRLLEAMDHQENAIILDTRTREDHESWPVRWVKSIPTLSMPYYDFMDHREESMEKIPRDKEIYIICNRGNASDEIVEVLNEKGFRAHSVFTGMKAWGSLYHNGVIEESDTYRVTQVNRIAKGCLSYILESEGEAAIIDPSRHIDQYLDYLKKNSLELKYIFDTHLHADHISGAKELLEKTGARYIIHDEDAKGGTLPVESPGERKSYPLGKHRIQLDAIHSPGHTPGSTFFYFAERFLFTGDILFLSSMGRPDLGGEAARWVKDLWATTRKLADYPGETLILPAHHSGVDEFDNGGKVHATLEKLRKTNPLLVVQDPETFEKEILKSLPEQPESYQTMRRTNLGVETPDAEQMEELELGRNRCAVEAYREAKASG